MAKRQRQAMNDYVSVGFARGYDLRFGGKHNSEKVVAQRQAAAHVQGRAAGGKYVYLMMQGVQRDEDGARVELEDIRMDRSMEK